MCSGWWHSSLIFACVFILYFTFIVDDDRLHLMTIKYCTFFHYLQVYCWLVFKGFSPFFSCSLRETATEIQFSKLLNFSFRKKNIFSMFWQVEEEKKIGVHFPIENSCHADIELKCFDISFGCRCFFKRKAPLQWSRLFSVLQNFKLYFLLCQKFF